MAGTTSFARRRTIRPSCPMRTSRRHTICSEDPTASSWLATTLDDAIAAMDRTNTERALVGVTTRPQHEVGSGAVDFASLEFGVEACRRQPDRIRLVAQLHNVSSPHAAAQIVRDHGALDEVVAIGVFPAALGCDLNDRKLYPAYSACIDLNLPVRINIGIAGPLVPSKHQHPALLEELMIDFPDLTVIGCHMGHPYEQLVIRLMMKFPRLYLMTSGYLPKYFHPDLVRFISSSSRCRAGALRQRSPRHPARPRARGGSQAADQRGCTRAVPRLRALRGHRLGMMSLRRERRPRCRAVASCCHP